MDSKILNDYTAEDIIKELKLVTWQQQTWPHKSFFDLAEDALRRKETIFKDIFVLDDSYILYQNEIIIAYIAEQKNKTKRKVKSGK
jgi:hypothetical protein